MYWVFSRSHLLYQSLSLNNYKNGSFCKLICFLSLANTRHTRTKKRYKEYRPIGCYLKRAVTKYLWLSSRIPIFIVLKQVNTIGLQWRKKSLLSKMSGSLSVYNLLTHAYQNFNNWRTIHKHALTMHLIYEKWVLFEI